MRKTFLFLCALCTSMIAFGQLKITPNGLFKVNNILAGNIGQINLQNVSFGYEALSNSSGGTNVAIGYHALYTNTTGFQNTANGNFALYSNTEGTCNSANGYIALYNNTTGSCNSACGLFALYSNMTGDYNTAIGYLANVSSNNLTNATAIGYNAKVNANNKVVIGNTSVISIVGANNVTIVSDGRTKKNIQANVPGLAFINHLQPVTYNFDLDAMDELQKSDDPKINSFRDSLRMARSPKEEEIEAQARAGKEKIVYTGFIAQDVENVAKSIGYDFSGVDAPENGKGAYGLRYAEFVVPLVKAVQELSEQNDKLIEQNNRQQEQINELKTEIDELKKSNSADVILKAQPAQQSDDIFTQQGEQPATFYQNTPNPFSQSTEIKYYLPASVKIASLCIYDLYGKQLKQIRLSQRGNSSQIISGSEFSAGIYLYALIADDKEIDVKRMILTE